MSDYDARAQLLRSTIMSRALDYKDPQAGLFAIAWALGGVETSLDVISSSIADIASAVAPVED